MKYWKKDRNYRKYIDAGGIVRHVITVDGVDVNVTAEVYRAYAQADRRERYAREREKGVLLSLERLEEDNVQLGYLTDIRVPSAEDTALRQLRIAQMMDAVGQLSEDEKNLIVQLFFEGIALRELARRYGLQHRAVICRRDKILKKLRRLMGE